MAETQENGVRMGLGCAESGISRGQQRSERIEIDTTAPFESVKEAVSRFGGLGYWKPSHNHKRHETEMDGEEINIAKLEEQAAELEKDLNVKERETFEVLKELEATKTTVEELKSRLQREVFEGSDIIKTNMDLVFSEAEKENYRITHPNLMGVSSPSPNSSPGLILMELKQAKLNLSRTTHDLSDIRTSVELLNKKLEKERLSLEKTRNILTQNSSNVSRLEEKLKQTRVKLKLAKDLEFSGGSDNSSEISRELHRLSSEADQFKKLGEAARLAVQMATSEIEETKTKIKTAEIRLIAARKMKEAARATEAVALAEIKAISNSESPSQNSEAVTLSCEDYSSLTQKARDAEEQANKRVVDAMLQIDEAKVSKLDILKQVGEATEEVKTSKKALEEALKRVEAANYAKLEMEEALRKWRSENGQKKRSVHNTAKFKNPCPSQHRREPRIIDVNGISLVNEGLTPVLKPTMSIGQILSRKLLLAEEPDIETVSEKGTSKRKISLGQMLSKKNGDVRSNKKDEKENGRSVTGKRKKFGFARFSLLLAKQNKRKKKTTLNFR